MAIPKMSTIMVFILELRKRKHRKVSNLPKTPWSVSDRAMIQTWVCLRAMCCFWWCVLPASGTFMLINAAHPASPGSHALSSMDPSLLPARSSVFLLQTFNRTLTFSDGIDHILPCIMNLVSMQSLVHVLCLHFKCFRSRIVSLSSLYPSPNQE